MEIIKIYNNHISGRHLNQTIEIIEGGGVIILPTDTLYAVACDAMNQKAIERVCRLKGINPEKTNLSILCNDISMVSEYTRFDNYAFRLLKENTPGPFTFLLKAASSLPRAFKGRKTVGIRIPDNNADITIIERLGHPLLSTSIRYDEEDYGINPELISENYEEKVDLMIEGEDGKLIPSAIIDCTGESPLILREGPIPISGIS